MRLNTPCLFAVLIAVGSGNCGISQADEEMAAVSALKANLLRLEHVELKAVFQTSYSSNKLMLEKKADKPFVRAGKTMSVLFRRDADRTMISSIEQWVDKKGVGKQHQHEWIHQNGDVLYVAAQLDEKLVQVPAAANDQMLSFSSKRLGGDLANEDLRGVIEGLNQNAIAIGYLGYFPIREYFAEPAAVTTVEEEGLLKIDSESTLGHLEMWLDRSAGFLPRKLRLVKVGAHLTNKGRQVDDVKMNGDKDMWPSGRVKQMTWSADDIVIGEQAGVFYLQKIDLSEVIESVAGPVITSTTRAEIEVADFEPSFVDADFTPRLKIPTGTAATVVGAEYLPYEWNGANVVPSPPRAVEAKPTIEVAQNSNRILILLNLAAAIVIAGIVAYRKLYHAN